MKKFVEIYFNNLDKETQKELLKLFKIKKPEEANWDVFPLDVIEEPEPEEEEEKESKTWVCSECGYEEEWDYKALAEKGEPVCPKCDSDMVLKKDIEEEEFWCMKCGKVISRGEHDDYEGKCATCWHERNN